MIVKPVRDPLRRRIQSTLIERVFCDISGFVMLARCGSTFCFLTCRWEYITMVLNDMSF